MRMYLHLVPPRLPSFPARCSSRRYLPLQCKHRSLDRMNEEIQRAHKAAHIHLISHKKLQVQVSSTAGNMALHDSSHALATSYLEGLVEDAVAMVRGGLECDALEADVHKLQSFAEVNKEHLRACARSPKNLTRKSVANGASVALCLSSGKIYKAQHGAKDTARTKLRVAEAEYCFELRWAVGVLRFEQGLQSKMMEVRRSKK
eukprot:4730043-Amphidinium_carterae.1